MDTAPADPDPTPAATSTRRRPLWLETAVLLVVALVLALGIKTFLVQAFSIPSESMEPGLVKDDRILVEKPSYWFGAAPGRGDVVVFEDPGGWLDAAETQAPTNALTRALTTIGLRPSGGFLVKRVVGVAGDTIVCCDAEGRISVNGTPLDEDAFIEPQATCDGPMIASCSWTAGPVPDDHLFVMGDNRDDSRDSSVHLCTRPATPRCNPADAFVPDDLVVGRVFARIWPLDRFTAVGRPATFDSIGP